MCVCVCVCERERERERERQTDRQTDRNRQKQTGSVSVFARVCDFLCKHKALYRTSYIFAAETVYYTYLYVVEIR